MTSTGSGDVLLRAAQGLLGLGVLLAVAANGAVDLSVQAAVALLVGAAALVTALLPAERLSERGWSVRLLPTLAAVCVAGVASQVPLPGNIEAWIAPGRSSVHPIDALRGAGPYITALVGAVVLSVVVRPGKRRIERPIMVALLAIVTVAWTHRMANLSALYGILPVRATSSWAPLVNPNFVGTLLVGLLPAALFGTIRRASPRRLWTWFGAVASIAGLGTLMATGSLGAWLGLTAALAAAAVLLLPWRVPALPSFVAMALVAALAWPAAILEERFSTSRSLTQRLEQWSGSLALFRDNWLLGVGPGGYEASFPPYQAPYRFVEYAHAHSDPLEWLVEFGVIGSTLLLSSLALWPRARPRGITSRGTWVQVGLIGVMVQSTVDFPLHLPGLLLLFLLTVVWRRTAFHPKRHAAAPLVRATLAATGLLGLALGAWLAYASAVDLMLARLSAAPNDHAVAATLEKWAPWRPEPEIQAVRELARNPQDHAQASARAHRLVEDYPDDPEVLLQCGAVLTHLRELDEADRWLERASKRHRADHRPWALRSRIAQAQGRDDAALELWSEALRRWPVSLLPKDRPFDRALQLMPIGVYWTDVLDDGSGPALSMHLAQALMEREDWGAALLALEQGERGHPGFELYPHKGRVLIELGMVDEGLEHLARADTADEDGLARRWRARALLDAGHFEEAAQDARASLREDPHNVEAARLLLDAAAGSGGPKAAIEAFDSLPSGAAARDIGVATRAARAAADGALWSRCIDILSASDVELPRASKEVLERCRQACPLCSQ